MLSCINSSKNYLRMTNSSCGAVSKDLKGDNQRYLLENPDNAGRDREVGKGLKFDLSDPSSSFDIIKTNSGTQNAKVVIAKNTIVNH